MKNPKIQYWCADSPKSSCFSRTEFHCNLQNEYYHLTQTLYRHLRLLSRLFLTFLMLFACGNVLRKRFNPEIGTNLGKYDAVLTFTQHL
jgi:hypothetical protein